MLLKYDVVLLLGGGEGGGVGIKSGRLPFSNELTPLKQQQLTPALLL